MMDVKDAIKGQYHAAFRMLRECIEVCPDELWVAGDFPREFWKIAYHTIFYGHLYMGQNEAAFKEWRKHDYKATELWAEDAIPLEPFSKEEVLEYLDEVRATINETVESLDLDTDDPGFHWYKNINKLEHELLSIRHIQGHVGQLSERLFAAGIETTWYSRRA